MCVPQCQNGGVCSQPNICDCVDTGYTGDHCQMCTLLYLAGSTKDGICKLYFFQPSVFQIVRMKVFVVNQVYVTAQAQDMRGTDVKYVCYCNLTYYSE